MKVYFSSAFVLVFLFLSQSSLAQENGENVEPAKETGPEHEGDVPWTLPEPGRENEKEGGGEQLSPTDDDTSSGNSEEMTESTTILLNDGFDQMTTNETSETEEENKGDNSNNDDASSTASIPEEEEDRNITSSSPSNSTTQDPSLPTPELPPQDANTPTWSLALFTLLLSFAALFTGLYFLRNYMIRRRREDQRKLLRASSNSIEGFFYGEEGNERSRGQFHDAF